MIPNEIEPRRKMITYMIDRLRDEYDNLSIWEQNFLDSINEQFDNRQNLTDTQCKKLEQIYDKF